LKKFSSICTECIFGTFFASLEFIAIYTSLSVKPTCCGITLFEYEDFWKSKGSQESLNRIKNLFQRVFLDHSGAPYSSSGATGDSNFFAVKKNSA
jgi:hypothetical protein